MGNSCNFLQNRHILWIIIVISWILWLIVVTPHLHEYRMLREPGEDYFDLLDRGYDRWVFEKSILTKAMEDSIGRDAAALWIAEYYGEEDNHE